MKKHCLKMHKTPVFLDVHLHIYLQGSRRWFFSQAAKSSSEWWFNEVKKPYALAKRFTGSSVVKWDELRWPVRHHKWCRQRHRHSTASGQHWWLWTWTSVRPGRPARRRSSPMAAKKKMRERNWVRPKVVTSTLFIQILLFLWEEELMCGQNYLHIAIRRHRDHSY